jgi:hypothetical protein
MTTMSDLRGEYDVRFAIGNSKLPSEFRYFEIRVVAANGDKARKLVRYALSEIRREGQRHIIRWLRFIALSDDPLTSHESAIQLIEDEIDAACQKEKP